MGVPVIHLQGHLEIDLSPFFTTPEAALEVQDLPTFLDALDAVLEQSERLRTAQSCWNKLLRETFFAVDGKATERFLVAAAEWLAADASPEVPAAVRHSITVS